MNARTTAMAEAVSKMNSRLNIVRDLANLAIHQLEYKCPLIADDRSSVLDGSVEAEIADESAFVAAMVNESESDNILDPTVLLQMIPDSEFVDDKKDDDARFVGNDAPFIDDLRQLSTTPMPLVGIGFAGRLLRLKESNTVALQKQEVINVVFKVFKNLFASSTHWLRLIGSCYQLTSIADYEFTDVDFVSNLEFEGLKQLAGAVKSELAAKAGKRFIAGGKTWGCQNVTVISFGVKCLAFEKRNPTRRRHSPFNFHIDISGVTESETECLSVRHGELIRHVFSQRRDVHLMVLLFKKYFQTVQQYGRRQQQRGFNGVMLSIVVIYAASHISSPLIRFGDSLAELPTMNPSTVADYSDLVFVPRLLAVVDLLIKDAFKHDFSLTSPALPIVIPDASVVFRLDDTTLDTHLRLFEMDKIVDSLLTLKTVLINEPYQLLKDIGL